MKLIWSILLLSFSLNGFSQSAADVPGWVMYYSDEFDSLKTDSWKPANNSDGFASNRNRQSFNRKLVYTSRPENIRWESGNLIIRVNAEKYSCPANERDMYGCSAEGQSTLPYEFTSGSVESKNPFRFGLIEARVKIPDIKGLNAAFWLLNGSDPFQEIDIFEMIPGARTDGLNQMHDKFVMTSNWHLLGGVDLSSEGQTSLSFVDDYTQYHNYAIEWTTSKLIFYVDGKVVRNTIHGGMLNRPLWPIFSIGFSDYLAPLPENFPGEMKVDWIRAYKLKYDCGTTIDSCQYSFTTANSPILKRISIGGSGCVNTVPQGADIYLRASEGIEISGDFTVPSGAELFLDSNPCLGE